MEIRDEIRRQGMERAAMIWEMLETLPEPIEAVNVYKAACSCKCAEFMARLRGNPIFEAVAGYLVHFMDSTINVVKEFASISSKGEGMHVVEFFEQIMPLTAEIFADPAAYAIRQHVYDGIIMLAAVKMGKEVEVKKCIDALQADVAKMMLLSMFAERAGLEQESV